MQLKKACRDMLASAQLEDQAIIGVLDALQWSDRRLWQTGEHRIAVVKSHRKEIRTPSNTTCSGSTIYVPNGISIRPAIFAQRSRVTD